MKHRILPVLAILLGLALGGCAGCEDCNGMVPAPTETPFAASTARYGELHAWAASGNVVLPGDTAIAPLDPTLKSRWDSVVSLSNRNADLAAILADWNARSPKPEGWTVIDSLVGTASVTQLVRFSVDGVEQGALVRRPLSAAGKLPVVLFCHPSDDGMGSFYLDFFVSALGDLADQVLIVAPAFRGETASLGTDSVISPALGQSPWDRDVDDAMAALSAGLSLYSADSSRVAALGYSRGGGVALLASLRDPRIGSVFDISGPADLFAPSFQRVAIGLFAGGTSTLPGIKVLDTLLIKPFASGRISADSLRRGMLRRSPARWARSGLLPLTQAVHGDADSTVNIDQSYALVAAAPNQATLRTSSGANHLTVLFTKGLSDSLSTRLRSAWGM